MKRFYLLILLPAVSLAYFLVELFRRHGYEAVSAGLWLAIGLAIVAAVVAAWLACSHLLARYAGLDCDAARRLDLLSYLPFMLLPAYSFSGPRGALNLGTLALAAAVALSLALLAGILAYYRRAQLQATLAQPPLIPGLIAGAALLMRVSLIAANRFYVDEALYSYWGLLIASGRDIFLKTELVDKPPVFMYTLALFFKLFGPSEVAARLPNVIASVAGILILYELARELFGRPAAALSALFLALSPFDIQYAPTAFTDPLMVTLCLASCLLAARGRYWQAGLAIGLAAMTKPPAVFFVPLVLFLAGTRLAREGWGRQPLRTAGLQMGSGLMVTVAATFLWSSVIRANMASFVEAGSVHYGGLKLVAWGEVLPRLRGWGQYLQYLTGSAPLNRALLVGVPLLLGYGLWRRRTRPGWLFDWALVGFALWFLAVHTLASFAVWDRYLLGLAPIAALLLARIVLLPYDALASVGRWAWAKAAYGSLLAVLLAVALLPPTTVALRYGFPVGGDRGAFEGIQDVAAFFRSVASPDAFIFHHSLGWHYSFYLFGSPFHFIYYPTPEYLAEHVPRLPDWPKYVAVPDWEPASELEGALQKRGWHLQELRRTYRPNGTVSFTIYRVQPLAEGQPAPSGFPQGS